MEERNSFTKEELAIAKSVNLTAVAASLGYTVKRVGNYHIVKEMDSVRIYNRRSWFRWSREYDRGENGGSQIDFLRVFAGMEVKEAVFWLLDFAGYQRSADWKPSPVVVEKKEVERKPFVLPPPAPDNRYLYRYLMDERKPDMKRPATSPVIKNAEVKAGKGTVRTNIRQEQQVKSVTRTNQPNVAESSSNHKKSTVQKIQVNGKSARKTVTKHLEKGRKK